MSIDEYINVLEVTSGLSLKNSTRKDVIHSSKDYLDYKRLGLSMTDVVDYYITYFRNHGIERENSRKYYRTHFDTGDILEIVSQFISDKESDTGEYSKLCAELIKGYGALKLGGKSEGQCEGLIDGVIDKLVDMSISRYGEIRGDLVKIYEIDGIEVDLKGAKDIFTAEPMIGTTHSMDGLIYVIGKQFDEFKRLTEISLRSIDVKFIETAVCTEWKVLEE